MFSKKYETVLFGFLLSGLMSFIVSGISTYRALGLAGDFPAHWVGAWFAAWMVAFPVVLFAAPFTRRAVQYLVK